MPGLPNTYAGTILDFITNRVSLGTVAVAITTGVLTVSAQHSLKVGDPIRLGAITNAAPLVADTIYYVQSVPSSTTLTLSATVGGALLPTSSAGTSLSINKALFFALIKADPGVNPVMASISEVTDTGYARQLVTFSDPSLKTPWTTTNIPLINFGPFPSGMATGATYLALVESLSGVSGRVLYVWILPSMLLATAFESAQIPAGSTTLGW